MEQRANFLALCLLDALDDEDESVINNILNKYKVDPGFVQKDRGLAPLHYACGMSNHRLATEITRRFLECGADANVRTDENMTPLHVAAINGRLEIVRMLLQHGAELNVLDDNRKTPVLYAIDECHFDVFQLMRDHIFVHKFERQERNLDGNALEKSSSLLSQTNFENSLQLRAVAAPLLQQQHASTPNRCKHNINKNLLAVTAVSAGEDASNNKYTPNRKHYNYDVTSPYYINITHRRHKPQPSYPAKADVADQNAMHRSTEREETTNSPEATSHAINIFTLTKENLQELNTKVPAAEKSRLSLVDTWRQKVQLSRARASILKQFDDLGEMIDNVMQEDHLNFTNTVLRSAKTKLDSADVDSGACDSGSADSSCHDDTEYAQLPQSVSPKRNLVNMSLGQLIQKVAQAQVVNAVVEEPDTSYQTVPEIVVSSDDKVQSNKLHVTANADTSNFIRSPKNDEYILQMTEAYVHTDDENGLVFYEKKLLSNQMETESNKNKKVPDNKCTPKKLPNLDTTATSQSTNFTLPLDYETDALRAELTTFGELPGPITKSTKRLYIKRLIKYKRKTVAMLEQQKKNGVNEIKFSVELNRTVRSAECFESISDYMKLELLSKAFFANNQQKKKMREGHLKQSFIYMLIDPRISCNLPGESAFLDKFAVWKRFLQSVFYVGKGKTSRPYSHLYDAMKTHSRLHNIQLQNTHNLNNGKKISIKKQPLNIELFKSPPTKSSDSKKLDRILNIWGNDNGVVCLHVFHNIVPTEAYTREAAIIDALSLQHLTNAKRGDYYGPAQTWTMKEKKYLGIALLHKAMHIYLNEGESQLSPSDLI